MHDGIQKKYGNTVESAGRRASDRSYRAVRLRERRKFFTLKGSHWESFDAGIAAQTFCLAAWDKGVGTVIMGLFDEKEIAKAVQIPEGQQICAVIARAIRWMFRTLPREKLWTN